MRGFGMKDIYEDYKDVAGKIIVALDLNPDNFYTTGSFKKAIKTFLTELEGSGVVIKVNSVLRFYGYGLIEEIHDHGLKVFADLKLNDISNTMVTDAKIIDAYKPEYLTVMASSGYDAMAKTKAILPNTKLLAVTVFTSWNDKDCKVVYGKDLNKQIIELANLAQKAKCDGIVCSPEELKMLSKLKLGLEFYTPGVRPKWSIVPGDDQKRVATPSDAFKNGAHAVVIGRPITQAKDSKEALLKVLKEVKEAV